MTFRYYCPSCKLPSNFTRCRRCGADTENNGAINILALKRPPLFSHAKRNSL